MPILLKFIIFLTAIFTVAGLARLDNTDELISEQAVKPNQVLNSHKDLSLELPTQYIITTPKTRSNPVKPAEDPQTTLPEERKEIAESETAAGLGQESESNSYKYVTTTVFWIGEKPGPDNNYISNEVSAWSSSWQHAYGGHDNPQDRCGYLPCNFTPKENPFYFALPYNDLAINAQQKKSALNIPWFKGVPAGESLVKNAWIEIKYQSRTCYAQWEDVGPYETDDFNYVFGNNMPKNKRGAGAGLDISPATWDCLQLETNDVTAWRFVEELKVPDGPWKNIITKTGTSW